MKKLKSAVLAFIIVCITISISGCLDVHLGKELFGKKTIPLELHYKIVEKANLSHTFNTIIPQSIIDEEEFNLTEKTERLLVRIKVSIKTIPELEFVPEFLQMILQYLQQTQQYLEQRYVTITLSLPDGTVYFNKTYRETADEALPIDYPTAGNWKLKVEASGIGHHDYPEYSDSYSVLAIARESL
ncbi:MAG: hypothetical protein AB1485_04205 [Candidatus Thermoplasmatota archaeon]